MKIYKFRNCFLNTLERRVIRDGKYLELSPKTFDVLQLLVERAGEIVTKDEMLGCIWNGRFVEEGNLPVHISKLRRLLEAKETERFIETIHGTGYRFVSPARVVDDDDWGKQLSGNGYFRKNQGVERFGFGNYNTREDIDHAFHVLLDAVQALRQLSPVRRDHAAK